jgi:hypothetical protein
LHHRVAEILRDRFADTAAAEPEALAHGGRFTVGSPSGATTGALNG